MSGHFINYRALAKRTGVPYGRRLFLAATPCAALPACGALLLLPVSLRAATPAGSAPASAWWLDYTPFLAVLLLLLMVATGLWGWRWRREARQLANALEKEQQRRRLTAYTTGVGYWEWHIPSHTIEVDARCAQLIGKCDGAGALYLDPQESHKEEPPWRPLFESVREDLDSGEVISERHLKFDGRECWLLLKGGSLGTAGVTTFGTLMDVSTLHSYQEKLIKLRITDALTGLLNRRYFLDRLAQSCAQCRRDGRVLSVALVTVANFRALNAERGYSAGDCALQQLAGMLQNHCRPYDLLGRFADHTLVLVFHDLDKTQVRGILQRFQERLRTTQILAGTQRFYCTLNCGVADSSELLTENLSVPELVSRVEQRLQQACRHGNSIISADAAA